LLLTVIEPLLLLPGIGLIVLLDLVQLSLQLI
jgi:hypothetical protein